MSDDRRLDSMIETGTMTTIGTHTNKMSAIMGVRRTPTASGDSVSVMLAHPDDMVSVSMTGTQYQTSAPDPRHLTHSRHAPVQPPVP